MMNAATAAVRYRISDNQIGILIYILAVFLLALMDASVKWLSGSYPVGEMVLFRSAFGFLPIAVLFLIEKKKEGSVSFSPRRPGMQLLRGTAVALITATFFWSLKELPLADATAISLAGPLLMVVFGVLFLRERAGASRWIAVIAGCAGVLLIVKPTPQALSIGAVAALASAVFYALAAIITRRLVQTDTYFVTSLWTNCLMLALAAIATASTEWVTPSPSDLLVLCLIGVAGGVSNILFIVAFRFAEVSLLATLDYTVFLWAVVFGFALFGDFPTALVWIGAGIVVASGIFIARAPSPEEPKIGD